MPRWDWLGLGERRWTKHDDEEIQPAKTAWDWLQLFVVPAMLAAIALAFNASQSSRDRHREDRRIAEDRVQARATRENDDLQRYLDRMSDLLLSHGLLRSSPGSGVRQVASNLTLATLRVLDGRHRGQVIEFLADAGLLRPSHGLRARRDPILYLDSADLRGADFRDTDHLYGVTLANAHLQHARFDGLFMFDVDLHDADLRNASFADTGLRVVRMTSADLRGAVLDRADIGSPARPGLTSGSSGPTSFTSACLSGASFVRATFNYASFNTAEGRGIDLRGARFAGPVDLDDAVLTGVRGRPPGWGVRRPHSADAIRHPCDDL